MAKVGGGEPSPARVPPIRVALVGNPNCGKSTLFNAIVGMRQRVGNFPGVTVEKKSGFWSDGRRTFELVDLPGVVSLAVSSADELITLQVLCGLRPDTPPPDIVLLVVDASHIERQLYLVSQVLELGLPTVLVLNMMDLAEAEGVQINIEELASRLAVPVVPTVAHRKQGIAAVLQALGRLAQGDGPRPQPVVAFPAAIAEELGRLEGLLCTHLPEALGGPKRRSEPTGSGGPADSWPYPRSERTAENQAATPKDTLPGYDPPAGSVGSLGTRPGRDYAVPPAWARFLAIRLLLDPPQGLLTQSLLPLWGGQLAEAVLRARQHIAEMGLDLTTVEPDARFAWAEKLARQTLTRRPFPTVTWTERIDAVLTHPVWGMLFLVATLLVTFQALYLVADPLVAIIQELLAWVSWSVEQWTEPGLFRSFLVDGLIGGVGTVLSFLPPIAVLFLLIGILEDCGYLTRASFLMDRWLAPVGLSGKCFIPLLTCFSCAVPGIMATRVIDDPRDRLKTILVTPLITCSARLPLFTLMTALLVPGEMGLFGGWLNLRGLVLASMYFLGVTAAGLAAWILSRTIVSGPLGIFIMELPHYKWPDLRTVAFRVQERVVIFLRNAGTIILAASLVVWALVNFPHNPEALLTDPVVRELRAKLASVQPGSAEEEMLRSELELAELAAIQRSSFLGQFGRLVEPVFWPAGWDWRIGCAVLASFPAREVVVANLGVLFQLGQVDRVAEGNYSRAIQEKLLAVRWEGSDRPLFTAPTILSLMVFFALCVQCASTLVAIGRETNSWRWPVFVFVYVTTLAYVAAVLTYQLAAAVTRLMAGT